MATAKNEHQRRVLDGVAVWAGYYRSNIHRFAEDYLHVHLKLFQIFLLYMMNICTTFVFIGFRGIGKSFLCAVFCCARAVLYPGSKIILASGTRGQADALAAYMETYLKNYSLNCWKTLRATFTTT